VEGSRFGFGFRLKLGLGFGIFVVDVYVMTCNNKDRCCVKVVTRSFDNDNQTDVNYICDGSRHSPVSTISHDYVCEYEYGHEKKFRGEVHLEYIVSSLQSRFPLHLPPVTIEAHGSKS
jgi:hypothetical protein